MSKPTVKTETTKIIDFNIYQLENIETGQRSLPVLMVDKSDLGILSMLALFNPKTVKEEYKNNWIAINWKDIQVLRLQKFRNGQAKVKEEFIIKLKDLGEVKDGNSKKV